MLCINLTYIGYVNFTMALNTIGTFFFCYDMFQEYDMFYDK
jgi:hypothetical protein